MFVDWLHKKGYTFNGPAPISGLTSMEMTLEQLGHILRMEQEEDKIKDATSQSTHSKSRSDTRRKAQELMQNKGYA